MKNNRYPQTLELHKLRKKLRQRRLKPVFVQWIATKKCNLFCKYCGTDASEAAHDELGTKEIIKTIDGLAALGCEYLSVTGGEPLMREDIFDVLNYAKNKKIKIGIVTNGYFTDKYIPQLKKLRLYGVSVSIDGYRDRHDKNRGMPDSYKKCMDSLDIYKRLKVPLIQVCSVVLKNNLKDIPKIIKDVFPRGCTRYRLQLLIPEGRAREKNTTPAMVKEALRIILKAHKEGFKVFAGDPFGYLGESEIFLRGYNFFCGSGWWTFTIMHNGDIMGCPAMDHPELSEGNIRETDIEKIWWNGFQRFRKTFIEDLPDICKKCEYLDACRGGCWAQRVSGGEFCYINTAKEVIREKIYKRKEVRKCIKK